MHLHSRISFIQALLENPCHSPEHVQTLGSKCQDFLCCLSCSTCRRDGTIHSLSAMRVRTQRRWRRGVVHVRLLCHLRILCPVIYSLLGGYDPDVLCENVAYPTEVLAWCTGEVGEAPDTRPGSLLWCVNIHWMSPCSSAAYPGRCS